MLRHSGISSYDDSIILSGYQKKLKTMKKKFFVLHKDTLSNVARLEYYDNEKKFKSGLPPKRVIKLKNCFNINRRLDTKYDYVIALSTKDSGFGIVLESEDDMYKWLEQLISLQRHNTNASDSSRPHYEHVWQVKVRKQGIAEEKGVIGNYYVCLSSKSLTFMRIGSEKSTFGDPRLPSVEISLTTIRRCGDTYCLFYMELGRQSSVGPGELWMETEDSLIAQNMHSMILSAMSAKTDSAIEPMRKRSSSANEASKPINVLQRRQTQPDSQVVNSSPQTAKLFGRERCDSLPSRNRTFSDCKTQNIAVASIHSPHNTMSIVLPPNHRHGNSPPMGSGITCSESEESSISIDDLDDNTNFQNYRYSSRTAEGVIFEENTDDIVNSENKCTDFREKMNTDSTLHDSLKLLDRTDESYVAMAPLIIADKRHMKPLDNLTYNSLGTSKIIPSQYICLKGTTSKSEIEFPEFLLDNTPMLNAEEMESDRPTRSYSIGSKIDHRNKYKWTGNINNESVDQINQQQQRVRAFSVGSRAKIPRCELQRSILFSKSSIEQNCNRSNNNILVNDVMASNPLVSTVINQREKKSTSAPILLHKSHNSVEQMGDLMEIDFSKGSTISSPVALSQYQSTAIPKFHQLSKSVPSNTFDHQIKRMDDMLSNRELVDPVQNYFTQLSMKPVTLPADNGYLEMKPVGSTPSSDTGSKIITNVKFSKAKNCNFDSKSNELEFAAKKDNISAVNMQKVDISFGSPQIVISKDNKELLPSSIALDVISGNQKTCELIKDRKSASMNAVNLSTDRDQSMSVQQSSQDALHNYILKSNSKEGLSDKSKKTVLPNTNANLSSFQRNSSSGSNDDYVNIDKNFDRNNSRPEKPIKLISMTNNSNIKQPNIESFPKSQKTRDASKLASDCITSKAYNCDVNTSEKKVIGHNGYEILHIKSDSSLQSQKVSNRITVGHIDQKQPTQTQFARPRSTNGTTPFNSSIPVLCNCTSSSTSCLSQFDMLTCTTPGTKDSNLSNDINFTQPSPTNITVKHLDTISRPPFVSLEQELHYADLDLKQCDKQVNSGITNKLTADQSMGGADCPIVATSACNNSYAKIDFDHSDSSSASSKNCN